VTNGGKQLGACALMRGAGRKARLDLGFAEMNAQSTR
jgi:hypothetical protein